MEIKISNKKYNVKEVKEPLELKQGLRDVTNLPTDNGMLFYLPQEELQVSFTMTGMSIPLDIVFINQNQEVVDIASNCLPGQRTIINNPDNLDEDDYIAYVLEINPNSGIKIGDELQLENNDSGPVMKVLALDGSTQAELWGGEIVFRRPFTRLLVNYAKKAESNIKDPEKYDRICMSIGRKMFKEIKRLRERPQEYVALKDMPK